MEQVVWSGFRDWPALHMGVHVTEPGGELVPSGHGTHWLLPGVDTVFIAQGVQDVAVPVALKVPAGHTRHWFRTGEYHPGTQLHRAEPAGVVKAVGHGKHMGLPGPGAKVFCGHL